MCRFVDDILDDVYSHDNSLLSLVARSAMSSTSNNDTPRNSHSPLHSYVTAHGATRAQQSSRLVSCERSDLLSVNGDGPAELDSSSHSAEHGSACMDNEGLAGVTASTRQPSRVSDLPSSSASDLISYLHARLAPLSDFLSQHLALLQTWLSCGSYGQLVTSLCQYIAQVNCVL